MNDLLSQMRYYLHNNFYPHVPTVMAQPCIDALGVAVYGEDHTDGLVDLPDGITWRGCTNAPWWALMDEFRLHNWVMECNECGTLYIYAETQDATYARCTDCAHVKQEA